MFDEINSVGEKVDESVNLKEFPFKVTRCDQIVSFPCAFINNDNDYRVRHTGFATISAHYTNLYVDKDGQKLVQQVLHTKMRNFPKLISGAAGCLKVFGDKGQKNMDICVSSMAQALNLIEVYKSFVRCGLGDNLSGIPSKDLKKLLGLCGVDRKSIEESPPHTAVAGEINNQKENLFKKNKDVEHMKNYLRNGNNKSKLPQFDYPSEKSNKWEQDRLSYFMPTPIRVPGSAPLAILPVGMSAGLNPINNPGVEPKTIHTESM